MSVCCWYWAEMAEYQYLLGKVSTSLEGQKALETLVSISIR